MKILVLNAGSSSLKYQLIDMDNEQVIAKGICERLGTAASCITAKSPKGEQTLKIAMPTHSEALGAALDALTSKKIGVISSLKEINAVGHRVLHGATDFTQSVLITEDVIKTCIDNMELGPLHMPGNINCILACRQVMGDVPMCAVFDTSFHQTMPDYASKYAIPEQACSEWRLRKYGFHGTSHKYVSGEARRILGEQNSSRIITCHLGNGASIAAVKDGKCIDTSMGFTPLEGLVMGTRSGDVDPAILEVLCRKLGKDISYVVNTYLNKCSGMLGVCDSGDMRDVTEKAKNGDKRAQLALDMFVYRVKKYIGSYAMALGGVDAIVMTGGIGENSNVVRAKILENMEFLGVKINNELNDKTFGRFADITADGATVKTLVIPTNEELVIARDTLSIISK